ncbi:hypothetical protein C2845_PM17G13760 [Panicum miliaceum]|uniref:Uncharacterized protein n=1 Tax=Panicum miliaceum TaxID=4540 RepID=A0A3L6Q2W2_PANMI|nr:hypothetical protein C2845_PM17G13760 [Panicum miliaceum]
MGQPLAATVRCSSSTFSLRAKWIYRHLTASIFINVGILLGYLLSNYAFADLPACLDWRVVYTAGRRRAATGALRCGGACTSGTPVEADLRLEEIKQAVAGSQRPNPETTTRSVGLGIEAIVLYSTLVFKQADVSSVDAIQGATLAVGAVKTLSILVAAFLSSRLGHRPLLPIQGGPYAKT